MTYEQQCAVSPGRILAICFSLPQSVRKNVINGLFSSNSHPKLD